MCPLLMVILLLVRMNQRLVQVCRNFVVTMVTVVIFVEFDQFLAQRVTVGTSLPPARTKPQMQKAEEQNDELFAL